MSHTIVVKPYKKNELSDKSYYVYCTECGIFGIFKRLSIRKKILEDRIILSPFSDSVFVESKSDGFVYVSDDKEIERMQSEN